MNIKTEQTLIYNGLIFILISGCILAGTTLACWILLPREPLPQFNIDMTQRQAVDAEKAKKPWWDQLMSGIRAKVQGKQMVKRDKDSGKNVAVKHGSGVPSTLTSEEQMILRQMILAEEQLASVEGRPPESAAKRLSTRHGYQPWADYELQRMAARIVGMNYERTRDPDLLMEYARTATAVANSDYANFEDYFHAGHANLFAGNIDQARNFLLAAEKQWPVKSGMTRGLNSLMILMCDAISNRQSEFFTRLETLQETFSDWMFTEVYLPDLVILEAAHPRAPLLHVLHGRLLDMAYNDAVALQHYRKADGLVGDSKRIVQRWIVEVEARRK